MYDEDCISCKCCKKKYSVSDRYELKRLQEKPFFCNETCKKNHHFNQKWMSKEYDPTPKPLTGRSSECIDRAFFKKKYGTSKRFKIVRG